MGWLDRLVQDCSLLGRVLPTLPRVPAFPGVNAFAGVSTQLPFYGGSFSLVPLAMNREQRRYPTEESEDGALSFTDLPQGLPHNAVIGLVRGSSG